MWPKCSRIKRLITDLIRSWSPMTQPRASPVSVWAFSNWASSRTLRRRGAAPWCGRNRALWRPMRWRFAVIWMGSRGVFHHHVKRPITFLWRVAQPVSSHPGDPGRQGLVHRPEAGPVTLTPSAPGAQSPAPHSGQPTRAQVWEKTAGHVMIHLARGCCRKTVNREGPALHQRPRGVQV